MNKKIATIYLRFCYICIIYLLRGLRRGLRRVQPFYFLFPNEPFFASVICCRGCFLLPEDVFLLHANLTVKMVDPTAGDPEVGESDPPGDAKQFPY
jgi:hypothetical protein